MEYRREMPLDDQEFIEMLYGMIQNIVKKEVKKELKNGYIKTYSAKVVSVDGDLVNVTIAGDDETILQGLKNKTGEILEVGNFVRLFSHTGSLSNAYVGFKKDIE